MDERVGEELTAPGDEVERFMAACSVLWCTPPGHGPGSEVVGAVMRPRVLEDLGRRAGFADRDPVDRAPVLALLPAAIAACRDGGCPSDGPRTRLGP